MAVKLTGHEYKAFLADPGVWKDGYWFEDVSVLLDGAEVGDDCEFDESTIADEAKVEVSGGCLYEGGEINAPFQDFDKVLRRWLKARSVTTLVLEVANDQLSAQRAAISALAGVRILR